MKKILKKREYVVIAVIIILFTLLSSLSMLSLRQMQGHARVINYVGIVRGATQKLIKEELNGVPDNILIEYLNSIVDNLLTGQGQHDLILLDDPQYLEQMAQVQTFWRQLTAEIYRVRHGENPHKLFDLSQDYFELVNKTVFAAEAYSEGQIGRVNWIISVINLIFIALIVISGIFVIKSIAISKRADTLGKIAYIDRMTQLDNRASCDRLIDRMNAFPTPGDIGVIMLDMNNLKIANDTLGHQIGDRMISQFAAILKYAAQSSGFVCRYGGDEFVAIFEDTDQQAVDAFIDKIREETGKYNARLTNPVEKLSFAAGYVVGNLIEAGIDTMLQKADKRMLENKNSMKEQNGIQQNARTRRFVDTGNAQGRIS